MQKYWKEWTFVLAYRVIRKIFEFSRNCLSYQGLPQRVNSNSQRYCNSPINFILNFTLSWLPMLSFKMFFSVCIYTYKSMINWLPMLIITDLVLFNWSSQAVYLWFGWFGGIATPISLGEKVIGTFKLYGKNFSKCCGNRKSDMTRNKWKYFNLLESIF